jgi:hypothetical protein
MKTLCITIMLTLLSACTGTDGFKEGFTSKSTCYRLPTGEMERCLDRYKEYEEKAAILKNTTK